MVPGQTSRQLLDSVSLDVLLHFSYGLMVEGAEPEERKRLDDELARMDVELADERRTVTKTLSDGRVVQISEARLARIRANVRGMQEISKRK